MDTNTKKVLFVGYIFFMVLAFFFREEYFTYLEFMYYSFVLLFSSSIILKFLTKRDSFYKFPLYVVAIIGVIGVILGLTQFVDTLMGGLIFVFGFWVIASSVAIYFLRPIVDRFLFDVKKRDRQTSELIINFVLFGAYFSFVGRDLYIGYVSIEMQIFNILLLVIALNVLYFLAKYLMNRFMKKLPFDFIYSVVAGMIVITLFNKYVDVSDSFYVNSNIIFLSFSLFISLNLIRDIFRISNK